MTYLKPKNKSFSYLTGEEGEVLEIIIRYEKGGINIFTSEETSRGYYLSITPTKLAKGDGYTTKEFTAFTGRKLLLEKANRYSGKKLEKIAEQYDNLIPEIVKAYEKNNSVDEAIREAVLSYC